MLRVIFHYNNRRGIDGGALYEIQCAVKPKIAAALSTEEHPLASHELVWVPTQFSERESRLPQPIAIEVEVPGHSDLKAKMTLERMQSLKVELYEILKKYEPSLLSEKYLVWIKYFDPDSCYV